MTDYKTVSEALAAGADPEMMCMTCPWDRFCITPPSMTRDDVDKQIEEAKAKDAEETAKRQAEGKDAGLPMGMLLTTIMFSGKETACQVCPVFALRLRTNEGQVLVGDIRRAMQKSSA